MVAEKNLEKSYKIRVSGNVNVVTVPNDVLKALKTTKITYVISGNDVRMVPVEEEPSFDETLTEIINQYHDALELLVDK